MTIKCLGRVFGFVMGVGALFGAMKYRPPRRKAGTAKAPVRKKAAKAPPAPPAETIVLRGDHSTTRALKDLVKAYEASKQGKVTVQPFSTISALDAVNLGTADIAGSARVAMPERAEERGTNFYPVAWDAVVPIVSFDNPVSNITLKQLHDLYLGKINNWKELGGPYSAINLYSISAPLDGVEFSARFLLFHFGDQSVSAPRLYVNVEKLEEGITIDPHGMGLSTFSGVAGNPKIKMLSVEGVRASIPTITDGSYPMYSALYLASRDDARKHDEISKFVAFAGSEQGKEILRKHDLVPYGDVPDLIGKQDTRIAFINERVFGTRPYRRPRWRRPARRCLRRTRRRRRCNGSRRLPSAPPKPRSAPRAPTPPRPTAPATDMRGMRIGAITLDLDDTLWPIGPVMLRAEECLDAWLKANCPRAAETYPILAMRELRDRIARENPHLAHDFTEQRKLSLQAALLPHGYDDAHVERAFAAFYDARNQIECYPDSSRRSRDLPKNIRWSASPTAMPI